MKKITLLSSLFIAFNFLALAQESKQTPLIMFSEDTVSLSEFEKVYLKNNGEGMLNKSTVDEYMELYINFKRKVMEAEALGLDTMEAFQKEFLNYRNQLAQPYFTIDEVKDELQREAYERMKTEIRASHILIKSKSTDSPKDTLKAYKKILDIRKRALKGDSFEDLASKYSDDGSAAQNKGDLGYFTAFHMVYPFESAAYNTKVGDISMPIKTQYGYHIIKVNDKRPSKGKVQVSHILISKSKKGDDDGKVLNAEEKAFEIHEKLINKEGDFAQMAKKFSDDTKTAGTGGVMPAFEVGKMIPTFEENAFALKEKGEISKPFKTEFGWHIIKLEDKMPIEDYEKLEKEIAVKVRKDARSSLTENAIVAKIKNQYNYKEYPQNKKEFYTLVDSSYFKSSWKIPANKKLSKPLFSINKKTYTQKDFAEYLMSQMRNRSHISIETLVNNQYNQYRRISLRSYKDSQLEKEYPEFGALVKEYHDGILLFNLTDQKVWSKAVKDSIGLEEFYSKNKDNYMWGKRAKAIIYTLQDEKMAKKARKMVSKKARKSYTSQDILGEINDDSELNLKIEEDIYSKGENDLVDSLWRAGISDIVINEDEYVFVEIVEIQEPRHMTIAEFRGRITADYQEYLEKQWLKELERKYPVKINQEALKKLKSEYN